MWLLLVTIALGGDAQSLYEAATAAERTGEPARAFALYEQSLALEPDAPYARRARARLEHLAARRGEDFAAYTQLEQLRRGEGDAPWEQAARLVEGPAPLEVRIEAAIWLAARSEGRERQALDLLEALEVPAENPQRRGYDHRLAQLQLAVAPEELAAEARSLAPVERALQDARDRRLAMLAGGVLLASTMPLAWAARAARGHRPWGLPLLWALGLGTWALAEAWEAGAGAAVPWAIAGSTAIHLLSVRALGRPQPVLRVAAALATVAIWWLALWATDTLSWVRAATMAP